MGSTSSSSNDILLIEKTLERTSEPVIRLNEPLLDETAGAIREVIERDHKHPAAATSESADEYKPFPFPTEFKESPFENKEAFVKFVASPNAVRAHVVEASQHPVVIDEREDLIGDENDGTEETQG